MSVYSDMLVCHTTIGDSIVLLTLDLRGSCNCHWLAAHLSTASVDLPPSDSPCACEERFRPGTRCSDVAGHIAGDQAQSNSDAQVTRGLDAQFADGNVAFADGFPFLLTSEVSHDRTVWCSSIHRATVINPATHFLPAVDAVEC